MSTKIHKNFNKKCTISIIDNFEEISEIILIFDNMFPFMLSDKVELNSYSKKLYEKSNVCLLKNESDYLGFAAFYTNDLDTNCAYLAQIAINNNYQNKGFGLELLNFICATSKKKGMNMLKLEVDSGNKKAIDFYVKFGFEFCQEASSNSVYMIKKI